MDRFGILGLICLCVGVVLLTMSCADTASAGKLDYTRHKVTVTDITGKGFEMYGMTGSGGQDVADGLGAEPMSAAWGLWMRKEAPTADKPAVLVFDYGKPIKVAALAHYFYVPGSRDHRWQDWLSGPSAFGEVRVYTSDDNEKWTEVSHLSGLPIGCPQLLKVERPTAARYLKLEILSLAKGVEWVRSYEIETYVDSAPKSLRAPNAKPTRHGFPYKAALKLADKAGSLELSADGKLLAFRLSAPGSDSPTSGKLDIRVNDQPATWTKTSTGKTAKFIGLTENSTLELTASFVKVGLLLQIKSKDPITYPFPKLDVIASLDSPIKEWCVPEYFYSNSKAPEKPISIPSATVPTAISMVGDGKNVITLVPDTDRSWVGIQGDTAVNTFPVGPETNQVLVLASKGNWFSGFERAAAEVYNFDEPRQFSPVSQAIPDICGYLLQPNLWSEKHQMLRSFPDVDFFYIFYSLPYCIPTLSYWEELSGDKTVSAKIDAILKFTLDRRLPEGSMQGAIFSEYADREVVEKSAIPYGYSPYYTWYVNYPNEKLIGLDQGCNRWITAHNQGAVLWAVTHVWRSRGKLTPEVLSAAKDVADWMVRFQKEDGSWSYAYKEDGTIASPMSDSGTIWNIWSLYRFGKLTGEKEYSEAATKGIAYFKKTFTANHLYRGYWEDIYGGGKTELNNAQGYEASIAAVAFAEFGDMEAMSISSKDSLRFICTRVLESRDYWTSYGGASEQQGWAPGSYIAPTFGYAAHLAWRKTGEDIFRRFSGLAKTIGWWQDKCGGAFWLAAAVRQQPIDMYRVEGGGRQFWALWDSAQKVAFSVPWLVDEVNRRSGDAIKLDKESLSGVDDRGVKVSARAFKGEVDSLSGQVNWLELESASGERQLVLINHAEATDVRVKSRFGKAPTAIRAFDEKGRPAQIKLAKTTPWVEIPLPEQWTAVVVWR